HEEKPCLLYVAGNAVAEDDPPCMMDAARERPAAGQSEPAARRLDLVAGRNDRGADQRVRIEIPDFVLRLVLEERNEHRMLAINIGDPCLRAVTLPQLDRRFAQHVPAEFRTAEPCGLAQAQQARVDQVDDGLVRHAAQLFALRRALAKDRRQLARTRHRLRAIELLRHGFATGAATSSSLPGSLPTRRA